MAYRRLWNPSDYTEDDPLPVQEREVPGFGSDSHRYICVVEHHGIGNGHRGAGGQWAPGGAALRAEESKRRKYSQLSSTYLFEPVAYETTGVCGESTSLVFKELGSKLCDASGDTRETAWLRQRISMAIVRGNAACVRASVSRLSGADPWIPP